MRIASIELAGKSKTTLSDGTPGLPRAFARISRKPGDDNITVELVIPGGERVHHVQADSEEDIWSMAECLQFQLDGCKGTNSTIHDYYRVLRQLSDC